MTDQTPEAYFDELGFDLSFNTDAGGTVWAHLTRRGNPSAIVRQYGRGTDEPSAAARAVQRWRQEQGD